ncbi:MAG: SEL1-like repeat protein, partial [Firmicutes bacterium]|nr:SEL1-like repeat protein [Bacillota bacterium]
AAQYNLGLMYENGEGADANLILALYWYRLAAQQGDEDAAARLDALTGGGN